MESKAVSLIDEMPLMVLSLASRSLEMTVPFGLWGRDIADMDRNIL